MRGKRAPKRAIAPDAKFGDIFVARFINYVMKDGKRSIAERIVYDAFDVVSDKTKQDALEVFHEAVKNVMPSLEVKSKRVGGANYQIPMPVRTERRYVLAYRWILTAARAKRANPPP